MREIEREWGGGRFIGTERERVYPDLYILLPVWIEMIRRQTSLSNSAASVSHALFMSIDIFSCFTLSNRRLANMALSHFTIVSGGSRCLVARVYYYHLRNWHTMGHACMR